MSKYAIWNKKDQIFTPIGEVLSAAQWIERYPIAGLENVTIVCGGGEINGSFFGTLNQMVENYTQEGCDFSSCVTPEDKLAVIEQFEENRYNNVNIAAQQKAENDAFYSKLTATSLASIAASMEYQNMLTLEDIEEI